MFWLTTALYLNDKGNMVDKYNKPTFTNFWYYCKYVF